MQHRQHARRLVHAAAFATALSGATWAQSTLYTLTGSANNDQLGIAVSLVGDLNNDGRAEFVIGASQVGILTSGKGYARVYNAASGAQMYLFLGAANGDAFGSAVGGSDVNNDGRVDIVVGAPAATSTGTGGGSHGGRVFVFNGLTGSATPLLTLNGLAGSALGTSAAGAGDVNGDGFADVIAGAPDNASGTGRAIVFSGNTGAVIWTINGVSTSDGLGLSVDGVGDVNGDGRSEFVVGSRLAGAKVYSGMTGGVLYTITGNGNDRRGYAVAGVGDVTGDGVPDFMIGAPQDGNALNLGNGYATIYNGATGAVHQTFTGDAQGDRFGISLGGGRDVTSDGRVDVIVGADQAGNSATGYARVFSGADSSVVHTVLGTTASDRLGSSVDVLGDISGDGRGEFIAGAPRATVGSFSVAGLARVYSCTPSFNAFCFGDPSDITHSATCPCSNFGATGHGCAHSFSVVGGLLAATGAPNPDTVVLNGSNLPATAFALFMQHDAPGDTVFHDGVLCAGGNLIRLRGRSASAGAVSFPNSTDTQTLSQRGSVTPGSGARRYYAVWYRNASTTFCPPATANVTNGFQIDW